MLRESQNQPDAHPEFVMHIPTGRVGRVVTGGAVSSEGSTTVRLAGGELTSAPAQEFRPATGPEIHKHHRAAASVRPLILPDLPLTQVATTWNHPGHRLEA